MRKFSSGNKPAVYGALTKNLHLDEHVSQGRIQLDRELHRLGITSVN